MKLQTVLLLSVVLSSQVSFGQKEANIWYFGKNAGLDFNGGAPVALTSGALNTSEGCSSISDTNGNILFYTDGITVYNKNHQTMTNGTGLLGNASSTQSALIVRKPVSYIIYYVFTVGEKGGPFNYSIVDMSLSLGLGSVTSKNNLILPSVAEKVTAISHANCMDIWVITHRWNSDALYAYQLTSVGFDTIPVISNSGTNVGGSTSNSIGQMKMSPDGNRLALAWDNYDEAQLFDFDDFTGMVTNPITVGFNYGFLRPLWCRIFSVK